MYGNNMIVFLRTCVYIYIYIYIYIYTHTEYIYIYIYIYIHTHTLLSATRSGGQAVPSGEDTCMAQVQHVLINFVIVFYVFIDVCFIVVFSCFLFLFT